MASIKKYNSGFRAQVFVLGVRESKTFTTKREATEWATNRELEIRELKSKPLGEQFTLRDALRKYANEISPTKRGCRWEQIRLAAFEERRLPLDVPISQIDTNHISLFRDDRLKSVSAGSVLRELTLLSAVFEATRIDWRWVDSNPCRDIRKPKQPKHRDRVLSPAEIKKMLKILEYTPKCEITSAKQSIAHCFLLALRTGIRAGDLCSLSWENVHDNYVFLPITKNGKPRVVPLSKKAKIIIEKMRGWNKELVFGLKTQSLDSMFRRYRDKQGLSYFTWHDTRHTAATMLSKKLKVLDLCKMFGWSDPLMAMIYYNPHASTIADLLNA